MREYDRIWSQLGRREIEAHIDLLLMTTSDVLFTMDVLNEIIVPAHSCGHNLPPLIICRMVNLSLEYDNSDGSCAAYLGLAMIAGQSGADRRLLILSRGAGPRIAAEATTGGDRIVGQLRDEAMPAAALPESVIQYVMRTNESVIIDDAAAQNPYSADPYIRQHHARSILCLPLLNQAKLIGVLYLENNLAPEVFAPRRIAVLKLLASQAAISLGRRSLKHPRHRENC